MYRVTKVHEAPSQISLVMNGHLEGFSLERLARMCRGMGTTVYLVVQGKRVAL